ncbi:MAG TPA: serine hydrolase domain-containing protein [Puia sp.]
MKNGCLIFAFIVFFFNGFCQSAENQIDSLMNSYYRSDLPGAVIAIEQNNKSVFKKGYGKANLLTGYSITADDNFNIGSLTKQFTAFAVLELSDKGKFSKNDSIGKFLTLPDPISSIRIGQLLSHCSGIPDHYAFVDTSKVKHATDKDVLQALQKSDSLYFTPGTHYRYSNTAYCLLGMLIEKISGLSYPEYLQKNIFIPLGIKDASIFQYGHPISKRVTGYDHSADGKFIKSDADESVFFSTEADGGLYISMNNYVKWCRAIESGRFSNTPMIRNAWEGQTPVDSVKGLWYGNGWFIHQSAGSEKFIYHTGFNGGFRTVVFMIPSIDYCISIFSNRNDIDLEELVNRINQILAVTHNSFIKSGPLESFIHTWPIFAPCKKTSLFSTLFTKNLNAKGMVLN